VVFDNQELDDLIIARSDGTPTYNFTVVIDDFDMSITHVIRGDDHLNNTPRQMNMLAALGAEQPVYAHLPMILGPDGAKLSKRHGAVDIREYRELGYLPVAMLNYLIRLGWSHGDQEVFSLEEMIELFDIADVNQSASSFNPEKLRWINQQHIIAGDAQCIGEALLPYLERAGLNPEHGPPVADVANGFRERAQTLVQMVESARYLFEDFDEIDAKAAKKHLRPVVLEPLRKVRERLADLAEWNEAGIEEAVERVAIDVTVSLVGRERTLERLDRAIELIEKRAQAAGH
jgi:glutamyl-tRNA synthetase